jgi:CrcB protein
MPVVWISLGAVLGANTRYLVNRAAAQWFGPAFPWGTLIVNLVGCLLVGAVGTMVTARLIERPDVVRLVVIVGFLGSLTTFSSFAYETHSLFQDGAWMRALLNATVSVVGGIAGVKLGVLLTPRLGGRL